jgi:ATP-binding cassette, subfamily B, bacterial RamA/AmfB
MTGAREPDADALALRRNADRLLRHVARHGAGWLALLAGASVAGSAAQLLLPAAVGRTLDAVLDPGRAAQSGLAQSGFAQSGFAQSGLAQSGFALSGPAVRWLAGCAALVAVIVLAGTAVQLAAGTASAASTARLRRLLACQVLGCGPGLLARFGAGDVVSRLVGGAAEAGAAPASMVLAATAVILPAGSVAALGLIDPWLVAAFAVGFPVLAWVLRTLVRDTSDVAARYQQAQGMIAARLVDALTGARTIAAAGTQDAERRRILAPLAMMRERGEAFWRIQARGMAQSTIIAPVLQVIVVAVAGVRLAQRAITPGELVAASQYAVLAVGVGASLGQLSRLGRARGGARRAAELLTVARPGYGPGQLRAGPGEVRFWCVTARRNGEEVLHQLELTVPGGTAVAVVGRSGAGQETLAALAGRLADPDEGSVTLDGTDLRALRRHWLREAIVYAFERPALFGQTPGEAISFGSWLATPQQVRAAARDSQAAAFLARLPAGLQTPLDRSPMSGGELQRLGLARAFAHASRARVLILDDATSSLDTATEMLVSRILTEQLRGRTRLIVTHRAGTAARADLVAWLEDGRVRALAPHGRLWAEPGYRAIFAAAPGPAC